jgi:hypothetical protein
MLLPELLVARIRGEYREMPGLRLTFAQACRLWQVDAGACDTVLKTLMAENVLVRTADGAFHGAAAASSGAGDAAQSCDWTEWNDCFTRSRPD